MSNRRSSKKLVSTCWSVLTDFCHYLHLLLIDSFWGSFWEIELFEGVAIVACVFSESFVVLKLNLRVYYLLNTLMLLMKLCEVLYEGKISGVEREWCNEMKNGQNLNLGYATPVSPQEISKRYKRQSLGIPKASPSSSTKISGHLSRHYILIASYIICYSWSIICFCFQFCFVLFAVVYGWILAYLFWRETRSVFIA